MHFIIASCSATDLIGVRPVPRLIRWTSSCPKSHSRGQIPSSATRLGIIRERLVKFLNLRNSQRNAELMIATKVNESPHQNNSTEPLSF